MCLLGPCIFKNELLISEQFCIYRKVVKLIEFQYTPIFPSIILHQQGTFVQLVKQYFYITIKSIFIQISLAFTQFSPHMIPFRILCYIQLSCLLRFHLTLTVSLALLIFDDLDSFDENWSDILQNISQLEFFFYDLGYQFLGGRLQRLSTILITLRIIINMIYDC